MGMSLQNQSLAMRPCVFCGKPIGAQLNRCPFCREAVPEVRVAAAPVRVGGREQMRRALLYMLLAGVIHFFAAGYSGMTLPFAVPPIVTAYLSPLVFMAGLGLLFYGIYLRYRS
jgi:hypothetical protein